MELALGKGEFSFLFFTEKELFQRVCLRVAD